MQILLSFYCNLWLSSKSEVGNSGRIVPFFVSREPHLGQKVYLNATKTVPRRPYVVPSCSKSVVLNLWLLVTHKKSDFNKDFDDPQVSGRDPAVDTVPPVENLCSKSLKTGHLLK